MADDMVKILGERKNEVLDIRGYQLWINRLGYLGGQPYIEERLTRFPAESNIDWSGGTRKDGSTVDGRKDNAYVIPYLNRIVNKINEYVFGEVPTRTNIRPEMEEDISSMGKSINELMKEVSSLVTINGWCWIGVDAPVIAEGMQVSLAQKEASKIRPYAQVYDASQVVDWYFDNTGELQWVITETTEYVASDPTKVPYNQEVRRLWEKGQVTKIVKVDGKYEVESIVALSLKESVPFILVGEISSDPHVFDSLESIYRTILDLSSANFSNYYNSVYPQLVLPASVIDTTMNMYNVEADEAAGMLKGFSYPILCESGDVTPSYIMPDSGSIESMRAELTSLKNELYESVGMLLRKESAAAESAEAKAFDHLDLEMLIRSRAMMLEAAEEKLSKMINSWDSDYPEYTVEYNKTLQIDEELAAPKDSII